MRDRASVHMPISLDKHPSNLFLSIVKTAIVETLGPEKCDVVFNLVPKVHAMSDIYCQLIPNEDDADPYYQVMPRMGAFEVSVNGCVSNLQNYS